MGKHYDWDNRCYIEGEGSPIDEDMKGIALEASEIFGCSEYKPQAVIVNYYKSKDYMGGHLDDGEPD